MFYTVRRFVESVRVLRNPELVVTAGKADSKEQSSFLRRLRLEVLCQIVISIALLVSGLYVLLSGQYSVTVCETASGWIGAVIGYWFR